MKTEEGDPRMDRLRAAGYDPEAMTHAEVVEAKDKLPEAFVVEVDAELLGRDPTDERAASAFITQRSEWKGANGRNDGSPVRTPCPLPRVLRPCECPAPSRVSRLAPNLIAALIGFCAGADPSFEAFERDRERGRR